MQEQTPSDDAMQPYGDEPTVWRSYEGSSHNRALALRAHQHYCQTITVTASHEGQDHRTTGPRNHRTTGPPYHRTQTGVGAQPEGPQSGSLKASASARRGHIRATMGPTMGASHAASRGWSVSSAVRYSIHSTIGQSTVRYGPKGRLSLYEAQSWRGLPAGAQKAARARSAWPRRRARSATMSRVVDDSHQSRPGAMPLAHARPAVAGQHARSLWCGPPNACCGAFQRPPVAARALRGFATAG